MGAAPPGVWWISTARVRLRLGWRVGMGVGVRVWPVRALVRLLGIRRIVVVVLIVRRTRVVRRRILCTSSMLAQGHIAMLMMIKQVLLLVHPLTT